MQPSEICLEIDAVLNLVVNVFVVNNYFVLHSSVWRRDIHSDDEKSIFYQVTDEVTLRLNFKMEHHIANIILCFPI